MTEKGRPCSGWCGLAVRSAGLGHRKHRPGWEAAAGCLPTPMARLGKVVQHPLCSRHGWGLSGCWRRHSRGTAEWVQSRWQLAVGNGVQEVGPCGYMIILLSSLLQRSQARNACTVSRCHLGPGTDGQETHLRGGKSLFQLCISPLEFASQA